jgi:hypothetical protein
VGVEQHPLTHSEAASQRPQPAGLPRLTFAWEPLIGLIGEGLPALVHRHWREIATAQDKVPLRVDWLAYLQREREGGWRAFVARRGGRIAGYIAFFFFQPERYRGSLFCVEDTIWVVPTERDRGVVWMRLVRESLKALPRPCTVQIKSRLTTKDGRSGRILERCGLTAKEVVYSAYLDRPSEDSQHERPAFLRDGSGPDPEA